LRDYETWAILAGIEHHGDYGVNYWWFKLGDDWTVPGVELTPEQPRGSYVVVSDEGRDKTAPFVEKLLGKSVRVVVVDPFFIGESHDIGGEDPLFCYPLLLSMVGERPLGLQAAQIIAVSRWVKAKYRNEPLTLSAEGSRTSLSCLVSAAVETEAIDGLDLHRSYESLKQVFEENGSYETNPEIFCFGLLEHFDVPQLACLVAPRPIEFHDVSGRLEEELSAVKRAFTSFDSHCGIFHKRNFSRS
jgi:hypothetical protein